MAKWRRSFSNESRRWQNDQRVGPGFGCPCARVRLLYEWSELPFLPTYYYVFVTIYQKYFFHESNQNHWRPILRRPTGSELFLARTTRHCMPSNWNMTRITYSTPPKWWGVMIGKLQPMEHCVEPAKVDRTVRRAIHLTFATILMSHFSFARAHGFFDMTWQTSLKASVVWA